MLTKVTIAWLALFGLLNCEAFAQTIELSAKTTVVGSYGTINGEGESQIMLIQGKTQQLFVRDKFGRPLPNVRVRLEAIALSWSVLFSGAQRFIEVTSDVNGMVTPISLNVQMTEYPMNYDRYGQAYGHANILVSLPDFPFEPLYLVGRIDALQSKVPNCFGGFGGFPAADLTLVPIAQGRVRVEAAARATVSPTESFSLDFPISGITLADGDRIVYRIPSYVGPMEIQLPSGTSNLRVIEVQSCTVSHRGLNQLSSADLEPAVKAVPINGYLAGLGIFAALLIARRELNLSKSSRCDFL